MQTDRKIRFPLFQRATEIGRLSRRLERDGFPRLQMMLIVTITGGFGFLASFAMLHAGLTEMWVRYLCAIGISYLVFLLLLWLWMRTKASGYADAGELANLVPSSHSSGASSTPFAGKGGTADGGGASGNFELAGDEIDIASSHARVDSHADTLSAAADADEFALPLVVLVMAGALLVSACWIVYSAPLLFAELLLDGLLAAGLYRRLRGVEPDYWLLTAVRRTLWTFMLVAMMFAAAGWIMQDAYPQARSVGEYIQLRAEQPNR